MIENIPRYFNRPHPSLFPHYRTLKKYDDVSLLSENRAFSQEHLELEKSSREMHEGTPLYPEIQRCFFFKKELNNSLKRVLENAENSPEPKRLKIR